MRLLATLTAAALALAGCKSPKAPDLANDPKTLAWRSSAPIADAAVQQITAQTGEEARAHKPWSEAGHVHSADGAPGDGKSRFVFGEKKIYLGEYEAPPGKFHPVDAKDDAVMAYAETLAQLEALARWARTASTSFDVALGPQQGKVTADGYDEGAQKLLADLQAKGGAPSDAELLEKEKARISARYADRR